MTFPWPCLGSFFHGLHSPLCQFIFTVNAAIKTKHIFLLIENKWKVEHYYFSAKNFFVLPYLFLVTSLPFFVPPYLFLYFYLYPHPLILLLFLNCPSFFLILLFSLSFPYYYPSLTSIFSSPAHFRLRIENKIRQRNCNKISAASLWKPSCVSWRTLARLPLLLVLIPFIQ